MNIFILDVNPYKAASYMCDAHIVKMIVESCQLLSTTDRLHGLKGDRYKISYQNHPCRLCLENECNYIWLQYHLYGLLKEYEFRYERIHSCYDLFKSYWHRDDTETLYNNNFNFREYYYELICSTTFPQCMPDEFRVKDSNGKISNNILDVVTAYRNYYKYKSTHLSRFSYKNSAKPGWLEE